MPTPVVLRLPRAWFDEWLATPPTWPGTHMAHAPLVLELQAGQCLALAGPPVLGPPQPLPALRAPGSMPPPGPGLLLVALAEPSELPPADGPAWEAWLLRHAPAWRLACTAVDPDVLVLWLRPDGLGALQFRRGALSPMGPAAQRWLPVPVLELPGGAMQRIALAGAQRQAPAGAPGSMGLQRLHVALVGVGRVGSVFAHGLARLGVQRLSLLDPDVMEDHNLDGDVAPWHEGRPKVEAVARYVRPLLAPGATVATHSLPVASPAAGRVLAGADLVVACVDNDAARLWANAWALSHNRCLLAVATGVHGHGAEADLRLLPAGSGCLGCVGGYAQASTLLPQLAQQGPAATPADFRVQRPGSLRSWAAMAAHLGVRLLEQHGAQPGGGALFRHLAEMADGGLQVRDWCPPVPLAPAPGRLRCPFCAGLQGAGLGAVSATRLGALTRQWLALGHPAEPHGANPPP